MAASAKSRRACGPSFVFRASARSCDAVKPPRNDTGIGMTNLHRSPPMNQSETDLGIVNESQLLRFGITCPQTITGGGRRQLPTGTRLTANREALRARYYSRYSMACRAFGPLLSRR